MLPDGALPGRLLTRLLDDAAMFPPARLPAAEAVAAHLVHRSAWYADAVGPLLVPVSAADGVLAAIAAAAPAGAEVRVSLVVDGPGEATHDALRAVLADGRVRLVAVEARHAMLGPDAAAVGENLRRLPDVVGYLEAPRADVQPTLDLVADGGWRAAKYRTGGTEPGSVPASAELAGFLVACARRGVGAKLTAGLHHAGRHTDGVTGDRQHGLVNVLAAAQAAAHGVDEAPVRAVLDIDDPRPLVDAMAQWDAADVAATRGLLRSVGCCGVTDPVGELAALGLRAAGRAA